MKLDSTGVIDINSSFVKICKRHPMAFVRALNMWFGVEQGNEKILFIIIHYFLLIVIAHSDGLILKETKWSLCHRIVKGAVLVAGYFVFESLIFPFIGITSSGIVNGSTAESVYHFLVYNNGLILSKNTLADAFHSCWKV